MLRRILFSWNYLISRSFTVMFRIVFLTETINIFCQQYLCWVDFVFSTIKNYEHTYTYSQKLVLIQTGPRIENSKLLSGGFFFYISALFVSEFLSRTTYTRSLTAWWCYVIFKMYMCHGHWNWVKMPRAAVIMLIALNYMLCFDHCLNKVWFQKNSIC